MAFSMYSYFFLLVNQSGRRYMNEDCWAQGKATYTIRQDPRHPWGYVIFDSKWKEEVLASEPYGGGLFWDSTMREYGKPMDMTGDEFAVNRCVEEGQDGWKADTLDERAEKIGGPADTFRATVDRYNELGAKGHDDDFGKRPELMTPVCRAPFYALKISGALLHIPAGLSVDTDMNVLNEFSEKIPGSTPSAMWRATSMASTTPLSWRATATAGASPSAGTWEEFWRKTINNSATHVKAALRQKSERRFSLHSAAHSARNRCRIAASCALVAVFFGARMPAPTPSMTPLVTATHGVQRPVAHIARVREPIERAGGRGACLPLIHCVAVEHRHHLLPRHIVHRPEQAAAIAVDHAVFRRPGDGVGIPQAEPTSVKGCRSASS
jgi:hypothetical protein